MSETSGWFPWKYRPWTSTQPSATTQAMNTITALGNTTAKDINMSSGGITGFSHHYCPTWLQAAAQTIDIHLAFRQQCGPWTASQTTPAVGGTKFHHEEEALTLL